jgi:hypothetical protein
LKRFEPERVYPRDVASRRVDPHHHTHTHTHRCTPATAGPRPGAVGTVRLRVVTRSRLLGRCHAAASHTPAPARAPHHWSESQRTSPLPPRPCRGSCGRRRSGETAATLCSAYNPPSPCARTHVTTICHRPPLPPAGELSPPLVPVTHISLEALP